MNDPAHTAKLGLAALLGNANPADAWKRLSARCSIATPIDQKTGDAVSKEADLAYISTHYSDQVAALCASHQTYRMAGYGLAILPYDDAESLIRKVSHHSHSFTPSAINDTIRNLVSGHYKVMIPISVPDIFRPVVNDINTHYLRGMEKIEIGTMLGQHYAVVPERSFQRLVNEWQRDKAAAPDPNATNQNAAIRAQPPRAAQAPAAPQPKHTTIVPLDETRRSTPKRVIHEGERTGQVVSLPSRRRD